MKKYAIFDHTIGEHSYHEVSQEEMTRLLVDKIIEMHLKMTNGQLWSIVEQVSDGRGNFGESYRNATADESPNMDLLKSELSKLVIELVNSKSQTE